MLYEVITSYCIHVASNPEFLAQGTAVYDTFNAERIIIGVENDIAASVKKDTVVVVKSTSYNFV